LNTALKQPIFNHNFDGTVILTANLTIGEFNYFTKKTIDEQKCEFEFDDNENNNFGKSWILTNKLNAAKSNSAFNYGWYSMQGWIKNEPKDEYLQADGWKVAQNVINPSSPYLHDDKHSDPSQLIYALVKDECHVLTDKDSYVCSEIQTGWDTTITELLMDDQYCDMLSYEGLMDIDSMM